jgi:hypothetical protein
MGFGMPLRQPVDLDTQFSGEKLDRFDANYPHDHFPLPVGAPTLVFGQWAGRGGGFVLVILGRHVCA